MTSSAAARLPPGDGCTLAEVGVDEGKIVKAVGGERFENALSPKAGKRARRQLAVRLNDPVEVLSELVVPPDGAEVPLALLEYRGELKAPLELRDDERPTRPEDPHGRIERLLRRSHVEQGEENADPRKRRSRDHGEAFGAGLDDGQPLADLRRQGGFRAELVEHGAAVVDHGDWATRADQHLGQIAGPRPQVGERPWSGCGEGRPVSVHDLPVIWHEVEDPVVARGVDVPGELVVASLAVLLVEPVFPV